MSTLTSASTLAQVQASYDDNASYAEDNSVGKCRAFLTACRILLRRTPRAAAAGAEQMQLTPDLIQKEMAAAQEWLGGHDTGSGSTAGGPRVTRVSFENSR